MCDKYYPCDFEDGYCPFDAPCLDDCRNHCGLGADEDSAPTDDDPTDFDDDVDESMNPYDGTYPWQEDTVMLGSEDY